MSTIHRTTITPSKLEMMAAWLPTRPWYRGSGTPELARAGGFRLDDPAGEVGIEFGFYRDTSGAEPVTYHIPVTFRGAALVGHEASLITTAEHGVLGPRWVYDATTDPVFTAQLSALIVGAATPQAQSISDTVDETVTVQPHPLPDLRITGPATDDAAGSSMPILVAGAVSSLQIVRVLEPHVHTAAAAQILARVFIANDEAGLPAGDHALTRVVTAG